MSVHSDWEPALTPHTFASGRKAKLNLNPNLFAVGGAMEQYVTLQSVGADGVDLSAVALPIIRAMWVEPAIGDPDAVILNDGEIPFSWLQTGEVMETLGLMSQGVADATSFREGDPGTGDPAGSDGVADTAKPRRRAATGKRAGVRS